MENESPLLIEGMEAITHTSRTPSIEYWAGAGGWGGKCLCRCRMGVSA